MKKITFTACILTSLLLTGCQEVPIYDSNKKNTTQSNTIVEDFHYDDSRYDELYDKLIEGKTTKQEAIEIFQSNGEQFDVVYESNNKLQTIWWNGSEGSSIGCDFVNDVCGYKNAYKGGVYKKND